MLQVHALILHAQTTLRYPVSCSTSVSVGQPFEFRVMNIWQVQMNIIFCLMLDVNFLIAQPS